MKTSDRLRCCVDMWAYDRGHSGGEAEIANIRAGLLWDLEEVFADIEAFENASSI